MYCLRSLGSRDRGFESHTRHGCLVCVCVCVWVVLCLGRGLATSWSPVQGVPLSVKWWRNWEISPHAPKWEQRGGENLRTAKFTSPWQYTQWWTPHLREVVTSAHGLWSLQSDAWWKVHRYHQEDAPSALSALILNMGPITRTRRPPTQLRYSE
jgi:hypothetical protein